MPPKPVPTPATLGPDAAQYEEDAVHGVYEAIAPHFSRTRYKPWPLINTFLSSLPAGSFGLDTGAGNGKYLPSITAAGSTAIALDRSQGLLNIASGMGGVGCVRADICDVPWRAGLFDFAISVAAIHHLSTPERRENAVRALLRSLGENARFFIYVWAWEQGPESKRKMGSRAGGDVVQDVLVPWVVKPGPGKQGAGKGKKGRRKGGERGDRGEGGQREEGGDGGKTEEDGAGEEDEEADKVYHRYYHLFVEGELRALVEAAARSEGFALDGQGRYLGVVREGWEADNWWIEGEVGRR
ncbi:S-adenosyl-L-methionine-dependent methyltransferase [Cutaneotrichosporon oleaginosum]|uniref:S-adenosyl-L-methionine-dependent methyltransferase n=1 Tax=Cutaneotrichosporon oleaginosum TaxID=879819 RepID=A0A0J0XYP1_9TREE|nr:S-adenosyl-L-methionine-dependent methyltransferase [Cutaneotrichosporon oleaginosum]KLT46170.1 S-adenosyl-L-methionine-dependent methyltransferase [Cutaneotrichosporon oleaginosum]TXT10179.1 hypothetical protein COLE_04113 [Cutaneotrichosporon oleaginosum]